MKAKCFSLEVKSKKSCPQKFDKFQRQTDLSQLRRPLTPRWIRWLTMSMNASSIDPEQ